MKDIKWLDGGNANGKYILELNFQDGGTGYLKNTDINKIREQMRVLYDSPELVGATLYCPVGKVIESKNKNKAAA